MSDHSQSDRSKHPIRNQAEWVSLGVSTLLLTGVIAAVTSLWLQPSLKPPTFSIEQGEIREEAGTYYVPITITNQGDGTAAEVTVEGSVGSGNQEEIANTTFDFVPAQSDVEGVLMFNQDPSDADIRVVSYQKP
ncbi:hypothetical protein ACQ4M4_21505 [Leptolyngbya sp. AN02str]|uniref:hypothetical protein n=1 Tax=Leptolyngbya sp. AN02str TaxID=3423363 RepID=UPI003D319586